MIKNKKKRKYLKIDLKNQLLLQFKINFYSLTSKIW